MATEGKARSNKQSTITFTLPLSCQICLGKVKQPVLCPNHHVFCQLCMDIWLEKNMQCPTCRVDINEENPVRNIIGGQLEDEENTKRSNADMRRARFELLYREYEDQFEQMKKELIILRTENNILAAQLKDAEEENENNKQVEDKKTNDGPNLLLLTQNLQEAQKLYTGIKEEMGNLKQENGKLKDENINLTRENETLRLEIAQRSPKKFGRFTVATLETKVSELEKENRQLKNALQRSDSYIDDLEKQIVIMSGEREVNQVNEMPRKSVGSIKVDDTLTGKNGYFESQQFDPGQTRSLITSNSSVKRTLFSQPAIPDSLEGQPSNKPENRHKDGTGQSFILNGHVLDEEELPHWTGHDQAVNSQKHPESIMKTGGGTSVPKICKKGKDPHTREKSSKKVQFDIRAEENVSSSFDLEMPSPYNGIANGVSPRHDQEVISVGKCVNDEKPNSVIQNSESNLRKLVSTKSSTTFDEYITNLIEKSNVTSSNRVYSESDLNIAHGTGDLRSSSSSSKFLDLRSHDTEDSSHLSFPDLNSPDKVIGESVNELNPKFKKSVENGDLNISITPELSDCLKLMAQAERKLELTPLDRKMFPERDVNPLKSTQENFSQLSLSKQIQPPISIPHSYPSMKSQSSASIQSFVPTADVSWKQKFFSTLSANPYKFESSLGPAARSQGLSSAKINIIDQSKALSLSESNLSTKLNGQDKDPYLSRESIHTSVRPSRELLHDSKFLLTSQSNADFFRPSFSTSTLTNLPGGGASSMSSSSHVLHAAFSGSTPSIDHNLFSFPSADVHRPVHQPPPYQPSSSTSSLPHSSLYSLPPNASTGLPVNSSVHSHIESVSSHSYPSSSHAFNNPLPPSLNNSALEWPDESSPELSMPSSNGIGFKSSGSLTVDSSDTLPVPSRDRGDLGQRSASFALRNGKHSNANSSYISSSLVSEENSFQLPEPKKRLFNYSDDDLELPSSPTKTTKR